MKKHISNIGNALRNRYVAASVGLGLASVGGSAFAQTDPISTAATGALTTAQTGAQTTGASVPLIVGVVVLVGIVVTMMKKA